jgi:hypothetical protein
MAASDPIDYVHCEFDCRTTRDWRTTRGWVLRYAILRPSAKLEMLTHFMPHSPSALWRERTEPRVTRRAVRLQALAQGVQSALLFVGATMLAVSIVIFLRIVLTAHQLPGLHEEVARFLPFLD